MIKLNIHNSGRIKLIIYFLRKEAFFFLMFLSLWKLAFSEKKKTSNKFFFFWEEKTSKEYWTLQ